MREGDDTKQKLSPMMIIGLLIAVGVAAAAGTYMTKLVSDNAPSDVVVLKADTTTFKELPQDQEKSEDAGTTSTVMVMIEELSENKDDVETITLRPDAPEMPEVEVEGGEVAEGEVAQAAPNTQDKTAQQDKAEQETAQQDTAQAGSDAETDKSDETATPKARPITPLVIENPVAKGPSMMVQLAAFRDQNKAEEVAALLTQKHKERLQGLTLGIMQADTGSSGIFWRVITEPLPTEDARALCDGLKRAGQDCIFRKVAVQ